MSSQVLDLQFKTPLGKDVQLWAVYFGERLSAITICVAPYGNAEYIEFPVLHEEA